MGYLEDFKLQLSNRDTAKLLQLWEEYCTSDEVNGHELEQILQTIKSSDDASSIGAYVELALPLWGEIEDADLSYNVLRLILDLQSTNSEQLAETAYNTLKARFGDQTYFGEKIRLVGLRSRDAFQGCISDYELLTHMDKGKFVFHTGGWGTGEIMDYSLVREELILEFEYVVGRREFSFQNAFNTLIPLESEHFLARRFGNPDNLEEEARKDPVKVIQMLLKDLGPKTAAEIKEELCELVIPEDDWVKWWQTARARIKKDTRIESPANVREPFRLRETELSHEDRFRKVIEKADDLQQLIQTVYNFSRDFPEILKNEDIKQLLREKLGLASKNNELSHAQALQIAFFQEQFFPEEKPNGSVEELISQTDNCFQLVEAIEIIAFKKRALVAMRSYRSDWAEIFLGMILNVSQSPLKEYLLKELNCPEQRDQLQERLRDLLKEPTKHPEAFIWYFQKLINDGDLPYSNHEGICTFFESLLILLHVIERDPNRRDLTKKIISILSGRRFEVVRNILQDSSIEFAQEFLLLVTKCSSLTDSDIKILHSLAEVVHPSLGDKAAKDTDEEEPIWTTQEGYEELQKRIKHIGTVETVENAKQIEAARALGDLRENSEYKFALEQRARLQGQLKLYSEQLNKARVLTTDDIHTEQIGVGSRVTMEDDNGQAITYTLLGPWDADPENNVLSFQSKFAKEMSGHKIGDTLEFNGKGYKVKAIESYLA